MVICVQVLFHFDADGNGEIDYQEFVELVMNSKVRFIYLFIYCCFIVVLYCSLCCVFMLKLVMLKLFGFSG